MYNKIIKDFPNLNSVMFGRGILSNPGLIGEIKEETFIDKKVLKNFHDEILNNYIELFKEEKNALFRMKELWGYMIYIFSDNKKYAKKIKKAQHLKEYRAAVDVLLRDRELQMPGGNEG